MKKKHYKKFVFHSIEKVFDLNKREKEKQQLIDFVKSGLEKESSKDFTEALESSKIVLVDTQFIFYK